MPLLSLVYVEEVKDHLAMLILKVNNIQIQKPLLKTLKWVKGKIIA